MGNIDPNNFAYGYTIQIDGKASVKAGGMIGGEITVARFSNQKYSNYNYVFAGTHSATSYGLQNGTSISAGFSLFVAYNDENKSVKPSSFAGKTFSMGLSGDLKGLVGGGFSLQVFHQQKTFFKKDGKA